jgi:N6-adenosine-specific RNA methylase IME4
VTNLFRTALLDPPWEERGSGKIKRGADRHYPLLKTQAMPGVITGSGLWTPAENAHCYLWVTSNFLEDGLWLMGELGFRYITNVVWVKRRPGIGRYFRGRHELLLFGTRGRGFAVRTERNDVQGAIETDDDFEDASAVDAEHEMVNGKRKHSAKPKIFYDMIESRSKGPYIEFFARSLREGWTNWGNDAAVASAPPVEPTVAPKEPKKPRTKPAVIAPTSSAPTCPKCGDNTLGRKVTMGGLCSGCAHKKPPDVMPIAEMTGADIMLNASREPPDPDCSLDLLEGPIRYDPPKYRAYAFANGKVQGEVPNQGFIVKVSDEPLPRMTGPSAIEQLEAAFADAEPPAFGHISGHLDEKTMEGDGPTEPEPPKLDGMFPTGPLPGGPSRHFPSTKLIPPPRPPNCPHGELRSACVLCRARR